MIAVNAVVSRLKTSIVARFHLALENLALRQQLKVLQRSGKRPKLRQRDRMFWVLLSAIWPDWHSVLVIVKPETVLGWRRHGFRLCRCWRSRSRKPGRPPINDEIRKLIRQMSRENVTWGAPRIESELRLLGYSVAERTVAKYMVRPSTSPTHTSKGRLFLCVTAPPRCRRTTFARHLSSLLAQMEFLLGTGC